MTARESGTPGEGQGRRDETGHGGIWPASGPLPAGDAPLVNQGELGQGMRAGEGAAAGPGGADRLTDPVCHAEVRAESAASTSEHRGRTYFFHSTECKAEFDRDPGRYAGSMSRRSAA